jgi:hypothetical protein
MAKHIRGLSFPGNSKITNRSSTIRNAYVAAIIPDRIPPESSTEINEVLKIFKQDPKKDITCVYCGNPATEWDHFRSIMSPKTKHKKSYEELPSGFIASIYNMVPSCSTCNQSKGSSDWLEWINGEAKKSPKKRNITGTEDRIRLLKKYENNWHKKHIDKTSIAKEHFSNVMVQEYFKEMDALIKKIEKHQKKAEEIKQGLIDKITIDRSGNKKKSIQSHQREKTSERLLPITLIPDNVDAFKKNILRTGKAKITIHYTNGKKDAKTWNASNLTKQSSIMNNLRSKSYLRQKTGISCVIVNSKNI